MRQKPPNARFLISGAAGGAVKITLRPGETLYHQHYADTEEGYRHYEARYSYDAGEITRDIDTVSQDCDGRHYRTTVHACPIADLTAHIYLDEEAGDVQFWPLWNRAR